jgi:selenide,water dikinase
VVRYPDDMKPPTSPRLIEKNVVLVGAGNAHLVFVKRFGMRPMPGVAVTLVNEFPESPYSAMVPARIAGEYRHEEVTIDLVRLCAAMGVRFLPERAIRLDTAARQLHFDQRVPLAYDALSLGLGSLPACPAGLGPGDHVFVMRPLGVFIARLEALERALRQAPRPYHFVVVGGGASGCELALAVSRRLGNLPDFRMTLLQGNSRLLPSFPGRTARFFRDALTARVIAVRVDARVESAEDGNLVLQTGERVPFDGVLLATHAAPPRLIGDSGLTLDPSGFLRVRETLQSVSDPSVFGTGDCVTFDAHPQLPRNGVHAVREGKVLFDNVGEFLHERPLRPFRPQRVTLSLLNTADGDAVLTYGPVTTKGRWARRLKDRIDRAWIEKYSTFPAMAPAGDGAEAEPLMRCGGCGSKVSGDVLSAVLKRLDIPEDPRILMGIRAGEDAAVHRVRPELFGTQPEKLLEVQTVDFFKAFIDDPYVFGRVAALNSVSDLYAMNARPFSALAIATVPYARGPVQEALLFELLSGAMRTFREAGVVLTGGHTTEGAELALGFAVTGHGEEGRLFEKGQLQPGDQLILTRPLGSGALLAAWMRGACKASWFAQLMQTMLLSNGPAGAIFDRAGVRACTDVTGFGLAGHLLEMLDASGAAAELSKKDVLVYKGFAEVVAGGIVSSLHKDNAKVACRVQSDAPPPAWLFDPQTSGGLLAGVKPEQVPATLNELHAAGYTRAGVIGIVTAIQNGEAPGVRLLCD